MLKKINSKLFWTGVVLSFIPFLVFVFDHPVKAFFGFLLMFLAWGVMSIFVFGKAEILNFRSALNASTEAIVVTDAEEQILYVNPAWEKLTGYTFHEARGKTPRILKSGKTKKSLYKKMWNKLSKGESFSTQAILNKRKNGEEYLTNLSISPVLDGEKIKYYIGIQTDTTQTKRVSQAKDEFISLASHQLRTPLTAMKWFCEMLLDEDAGKLNKKQKEYIHNIYDSNERMIGLVSTLLNISRIESGHIVIEPRPTNLVEMIKGTLRDFDLHIRRKKIKLIFSSHMKPGKIKLDPQLIHEVYTNLISNAIKYTPEGGEITILISRRDGEVITQISDTGCGIPKKDHQKIFQRFFRSDNAFVIHADGNGLGLYLVRAIVETSGGRIWFESEEGKGTTFWFTLPLEGMKAKNVKSGVRLAPKT